ncbi:MAG: phage holin family protein [Ruminococcaceae bacterium]|nr:phage holin family protein [Oscillospiraceae bacterium]
MVEDIASLEQVFEGFSINYGILLWVLIAFIVADFFTGIFRAYKNDGRVNSSKLRNGGFKKCGIIFVIVLGYVLSVTFNDKNFVIYHSIQAYYIYTELVSILENLEDLGVKLPKILEKVLGKKGE